MVRPGPTPTLVVAVVVLLLAGCSGVIPKLVVEHHVTVTNEGDSTQEVYLTIQKDGATVLNETALIDAGGNWHVTTLDERGDYQVVVETAVGEWVNESYSLPQVQGDRASILDVRIDEDGSVSTTLVRED